ncbi:Fpg/Nei family DNA glycosylase [Arthrobacter monumenti]
MPEGHSVHRLARQFNSVFAGHRVAVSSPQGRFAAGAERLDGHTLTSAAAHGKQLFLDFDNDLLLRVHLGLYGAWDFGGDATFRGASSIGAPRRVGEREISDDDGGASVAAPRAYSGPPEPVGAVRVRLVAEHGWADLRGPTACEVITEAEAAVVLSKLGPDPLRPDADPDEFVRRITSRGSPLGLLLMNQDVIAGVGNVYRAEVLFRQRLNPWRLGKSLSGEEARSLWKDISTAMGDGVRDGRIITTAPGDRTSLDPDVPAEDAHYVYKRAGLECRICGTPVALAEMSARKLYWCPSCQQD